MSETERSQKKLSQSERNERKSGEQIYALPQKDRVKAVQDNEVNSLKQLLDREHRKRMPDSSASSINEENAARFLEQPGIEKDLIGSILKIATDNNLTPDWVLVRALKVYVREYQRTGRL